MSSITKTAKTTKAEVQGALTPDFLNDLRGSFVMTEADSACHNAVTNNDINALALNREILKSDDGKFTHRIKSKGITNQKNSGRCWMFAALNVLRPQVIRDHHMEEFEFSIAYLQFWDKLEKANLFLEAAIELREVDYLDRDWEKACQDLLEDGGWWNFAKGLIDKYGVVPQSVMPETHSSENTAVINEVLSRLVQVWGVKMFDCFTSGGGEEDLRRLKDEALKEVYRLLVLTFGVPPKKFEWRYRHTRKSDHQNSDSEMLDSEETDLTPLAQYTPQSFYDSFVSRPLNEYVCLYHDPKNPLNRHYSFQRNHNIVGKEDMHFVNVDIGLIKDATVASILANDAVWFAVNMEMDQSGEHGLMASNLFDYEKLFGVSLTISKADRARFHAGVSGHAMALMGVDLTAEGKPRKWLVENSWGTEAAKEKGGGKDGFWTVYDDWFDEHVYAVILHKSQVSAETLAVFDEEPIQLPAWYPG